MAENSEGGSPKIKNVKPTDAVTTTISIDDLPVISAVESKWPLQTNSDIKQILRDAEGRSFTMEPDLDEKGKQKYDTEGTAILKKVYRNKK